MCCWLLQLNNKVMKSCLFLFLLFTGTALAQSTVKSIAHVSLSVRDLDRALAFYTKTMGLKVTDRQQIKAEVTVEKASGFAHKSRSMAVLQSPNARIELIQFDGATEEPISPMPIPGPGITHVCYQSPASVSIHAKAKANGASIVSRGGVPVDRGFGIRYSYIKDRDGIMFETEQLDKPKFADSLWVGHVAIVTHDIDRLVSFYTQLFGKEPVNRIDNIKNSPKLDDIANIDSLRLRGAWFMVGNMMLELWQFDNPATKPAEAPAPFTQIGYQKIVFDVGDINADYKRLIAKGVRFLSSPVATTKPTEVFFRDPDGNLLGLLSK